MVRGEFANGPKVLVIGAGPAGVTTALQLNATGVDCLLVERESFPRFKVCGCCLNMAALSALKSLELDHLLTSQVAQPLNRWEMRVGNRTITTSLPGGIAISRGLMDQILLEEAVKRGVQVRIACEAKVLQVDTDGVQVELRSASGPTGHEAYSSTHRFDVVVVASGLSGGGISKWLPYEQEPSGAVGAAVSLRHVPGVAPETIHMLCSSLGYVGLVQLEDGRIELATALRLKRSPQRKGREGVIEAIQEILTQCGFNRIGEVEVEALQTTPPLTRQRRVGHGRLIAVGDAAGYVEPFTGEGMAWAIENGLAAGATIAWWLSAQSAGTSRSTEPDLIPFAEREVAKELGEIWQHRYSALMRQRKWICRSLTRVVASDWWLRCLPVAIRIAPWGAKWVVNRLNHPGLGLCRLVLSLP